VSHSEGKRGVEVKKTELLIRKEDHQPERRKRGQEGPLNDSKIDERGGGNDEAKRKRKSLLFFSQRSRNRRHNKVDSGSHLGRGQGNNRGRNSYNGEGVTVTDQLEREGSTRGILLLGAARKCNVMHRHKPYQEKNKRGKGGE